MPTHRHALAQLDGGVFLTDGGLETSLIFDHGIDLPHFAAYPLLDSDEGRRALLTYLEPYLAVAARHGVGFVLETPTWRANAAWGERLGHDAEHLDRVNRDAVSFGAAVRAERPDAPPIVLSGTIGPRGDGYVADTTASVDEARAYHSAQVATFADTEVDLVSAMTLSTWEEAAGIALAARDHAVPAVIGFTVETDGRLPSGMSLGDAIGAVDEATGSSAAHFMINCAHPTHFAEQLDPTQPWTTRIRAIRANASTLSHAELDAAPELDSGDIPDLAERYAALQRALPHLSVFGGCCGTDHRHVGAIAAAVTANV